MVSNGLQQSARRAHNPKVVSSSLAPATKDDSSVFFIGESFFDPLYPLSSVRCREFTFRKIKFDIKQKRPS